MGVMACGHPEKRVGKKRVALRTDSAVERNEPGRCWSKQMEMLGLVKAELGRDPSVLVQVWWACGCLCVQRPGEACATCSSLGTFSFPPGWWESKRRDSRCGQRSGDMKALIPSHMDRDGKLSNYCGK